MIRISIHILFYILIICFFSSCNRETKETIDITNKVFPNGKHYTIEKTNKETTSIGIFSKHNYGTHHSFSYKLSIDPGSIHWNGGSGEPKHIIFCKDTTYIHYLKKKSIELAQTDSLKTNTEYTYKVQDVFEKHIDKRYFFNLFGDDYWVEILPEEYASIKNSCGEFLISNDNELSL